MNVKWGKIRKYQIFSHLMFRLYSLTESLMTTKQKRGDAVMRATLFVFMCCSS